MQLPSGTVTFLFSDIVGSTQYWEAFPETMGTALAQHDTLLRELIRLNGGEVFKTIGDAFCAAFNSDADAARAATAIQTAIATTNWPPETPIQVRLAIHSGLAESRDNDYFGRTVNRVARLLAIGHGGQILLSKVVSDSLAQSLDSEVELHDLGEHRLKDLARPEHVFELRVRTLKTVFPPLRSLDDPGMPNNLPQQLTTFVGRERELAEVNASLQKSRIVTLTGSGGCGKTRLALQVAAESLDAFPGGAWYVELGALNESALVPQAIAGALGIREQVGQPIVQAITAFLKDRNLLIVLDNCEHLIQASAGIVSTIVQSCPGVHVLATSREGLNISGEAMYRVPSLSQPNPRLHRTPASVADFESVKLFVDRATAVSAEFKVSAENAPALAQLCHQLDGIPMAIELAAARVRSLTIEQITSRLDDRFRLLTGGSRTSLPRQQTLRALVDWSYDLLNDAERALLRRLSTFAGGWTLEAAEMVAVGDPVEDWEILDLLTSLVDKSLVSFEAVGCSQRYRMLETVRRYGREKVSESQEETQTRDQHLAWFSNLAAEGYAEFRGSDQLKWLALLDVEQENLWQALEWAEATEAGEKGGEIAAVFGAFFAHKGALSEAILAIERGIKGLASSPEEVSILATLLFERAGIHYDSGELSHASDLAHQALSLFKSASDDLGVAKSENILGKVGMTAEDFEGASHHFQQAVELFGRAGDQLGVSIVRNNQGLLLRRKLSGNPEERAAQLNEASRLVGDALAIRVGLNDLRGQAETLNNLGVIAFDLGEYSEAWGKYQQSLGIERELKHTPGIGIALANLGEVAGMLNDKVLAVQALAIAERILAEIQSSLAGPVHSMLVEASTGMEEVQLGLLLANADSISTESFLDGILASHL